MPKAGLIHDYDLMANQEDASRGVTCAVCDTPNTTFQWSDYYGEAMCTVCGCPYQLKGGGEEMEAEGKYPYMSLRDAFLPIAREFWRETHIWVHYGMSFQRSDGKADLVKWGLRRYPEVFSEDK